MVKLFTPRGEWTLDIRKMKPFTQLVFLSAIVVLLVLVCFFVGLVVDFINQQMAYYALWGIGVGAVLAIIIVTLQCRKLFLAGGLRPTRPIDTIDDELDANSKAKKDTKNNKATKHTKAAKSTKSAKDIK